MPLEIYLESRNLRTEAMTSSLLVSEMMLSKGKPNTTMLDSPEAATAALVLFSP
jgi:hypothetical protein